MRAGETASYNGHEYALFPLEYVNCTQRGTPGDMDSYSHCCTYACDWGQGGSTARPVYAPFSGTLTNQGVANGRCYFTSDAEVWTPQGLHYVTLELVHDNNPPASGHYNQGELIYHTGNAPGPQAVTGPHVHIDQNYIQNSRIVNSGYACRGSSTGACWTLPDTQPPYEVFYMTGSENIVNLRGMVFQTVPAVPPSGGNILLLLMAAYRRKKRHGYSHLVRS